MNTQTKITLAEYQKRLGGYMGMLYYHYANLCIKADPVALLSTSVISEDGVEKIEDVAAVVPGDDDYTLEIYVAENRKLSPLTKGLLREHPEFKIDALRVEDHQEAQLPDDLNKKIYLLLTMPEVDKNRYDALKEAAEAFYKEADASIEKNKVIYTKRIFEYAQGEDQQEIDDLNEELDQTYDLHKDRVKEMHDEKLKEIEGAYKRYLSQHPGAETSASATESYVMSDDSNKDGGKDISKDSSKESNKANEKGMSKVSEKKPSPVVFGDVGQSLSMID